MPTQQTIIRTLASISDTFSMILLVFVGVLASIPEGLALYITASSLGPQISYPLAFSLPSISVAAIFLVVALPDNRKIVWLFVGQLVISSGITLALGGTWELFLPVATGFGGYVAGLGKTYIAQLADVSREDQKEYETFQWELDQKALDREALRSRTSNVQTSGQTVQQQARSLSESGLSVSEIAGVMSKSDRTIRRYLASTE